MSNARSVDPAGHMPSADSSSRIISLLIFACPVTAAIGSSFGSLSLAGQSFYPFKIVVPLLVLVNVGPTLRLLDRRGSYPQVLLLLATWGLIGLAWTENRAEGLREVSIIVFAALATAGIAASTHAVPGVRALIRGWLAATYLTAGVALWEIMSGQHLPNAFVMDRQGQVQGTMLSTFGNPNNFGAFLVLAVPFIGIAASGVGTSWGLTRRDVVAARVAGLVVPILLVLSGSRLAFIGLAATAATYVVLNRRWQSTWRFAVATTAAAVVLLVAAAATGQQIVSKFEALFHTSPFTVTSGETRVNLILNGFAFTLRTAGVGLGPAGYESAIGSGEYPYPLANSVVNPHNFWIEVLSQYGVLGSCLLATVLIGATLTTMRYRHDNGSIAAQRATGILLSGFVGYLFAAMVGSSYINAPENWMFIASYVAMIPALPLLSAKCAAPTYSRW